MAKIKPFQGIRPLKTKIKPIASQPYDVINSEEARLEASGNDLSFLHVVKPEIDFPSDANPYSSEIYEAARENFQSLIRKGLFFQDPEEYYYIYQLEMDGRKQTGLVACAHIDDYFEDVIKKHELTRPDKEEDRKNHVRYTEMNAEPVFFAYPAHEQLDRLITDFISIESPEYFFRADDRVIHRFWVVKDEVTIKNITTYFAEVSNTYVADGHHRTAAAALVGKEIRERKGEFTGQEEFNYFLAVHFPDNQLQIIDYNRIVKDLNGLSKDAFLQKLTDKFDVAKKDSPVKPTQKHQFGLYIEGEWYQLIAKSGTYNEKDPVGELDVTILSENVLEPILAIHDLRRDNRIDFVGGIRGLAELERRVDEEGWQLAFALYPVSINQLIRIADSGQIMPPKTTWFEPKLRSGLIVHSLK